MAIRKNSEQTKAEEVEQALRGRTVDRTGWSPGPWDDEPDVRSFTTGGENNLRCMVVRNRVGAWCGYVRVPTDHPWHGLSYSADPLHGLTVHGGLTWANRGVHGEEGWWLGFDCSHYGDHSPGLVSKLPPAVVIPGTSYRDMGYAINETRWLAEQIWAARNQPKAKRKGRRRDGKI